MPLTIKQSTDIEACRTLRKNVFIDEVGVDPTLERDDQDSNSIHILARNDNTPVGTARVLISGSTAIIGRVCVLEEFRGKGLGTDIIRACLDAARKNKTLERAELAALTSAIPFYEKLGFSICGPACEYANVVVQDMEISL